MITIDGIDYADMQERLLCDEETCLLIIRTFYEDVYQKYMNLLDEKDDERFATLAHGIKGACANVSAMSVSATAKALETKARAMGREACGKELIDLSRELVALLKNIRAYIKKEG